MRYAGTEEVAKILGVSRRRVQQLIDEGRIPGAWRVGERVWIVPVHEDDGGQDRVIVVPKRKEKRG